MIDGERAISAGRGLKEESSASRSSRSGEGTSRQLRLRHWTGPWTQAMPGIEQARPSGVRWQMTQPSVHSAQPGPGSPATGRAGAAERTAATISARSTAPAAAANAVTTARVSPRVVSSGFVMVPLIPKDEEARLAMIPHRPIDPKRRGSASLLERQELDEPLGPGRPGRGGRRSDQPNTRSPARPAAPTTIRHHAKGVKPWRET
jgi:hypothetical protein